MDDLDRFQGSTRRTWRPPFSFRPWMPMWTVVGCWARWKWNGPAPTTRTSRGKWFPRAWPAPASANASRVWPTVWWWPMEVDWRPRWVRCRMLCRPKCRTACRARFIHPAPIFLQSCRRKCCFPRRWSRRARMGKLLFVCLIDWLIDEVLDKYDWLIDWCKTYFQLCSFFKR